MEAWLGNNWATPVLGQIGSQAREVHGRKVVSAEQWQGEAATGWVLLSFISFFFFFSLFWPASVSSPVFSVVSFLYFSSLLSSSQGQREGELEALVCGGASQDDGLSCRGNRWRLETMRIW
jgi:hypothetical protein